MMHSILMIGQSNMAGRGIISEVDAIQNESISVYRNGTWRKLFAPVNFDNAASGISLVESFADAYQKEKGVEVGIIPCAVGDTQLSRWLPGTQLFDNAVAQAKIAARTSTIVAVLWHQGEGDGYAERYPVYEEKLRFIFESFRKELELYDVPFVVGGIGTFFHGDYMAEINAAIKHYADTNPMCGYASSEGLTANQDQIHFNAKSLREFGLRYYKAFQEIENKEKQFEKMPSEEDIMLECEREFFRRKQ